jgi:outer membrane protein
MKKQQFVSLSGKTIKSILLPAFLLMAGASLFAQTESSKILSLKQCLDIAFENNLDLKQAELKAASSAIDYRQARQNMLPAINGSIEHGSNQGRSIDPFTNSYLNQKIDYANYGLNGGVVLFSGMATQNNIQAQRLALAAGREEIQQAKDNLSLNIMTAYLQVLSTADLLEQIRIQANLSRKQVERLAILHEEGEVPPGQYYDLKGQLANDEINEVTTRNQFDAVLLALCQLMNIPYDPTLELEPVRPEDFLQTYEGDAASIYQTALNQLAVVKAAGLRTESAEKSVKASRSLLWPTLSLNGGLYTNYSSAARTAAYLRTVEAQTNEFVRINGAESPVFTIRDEFDMKKITYGDQFKNNYSTNINLGLRIPLVNSLQNRNRVNRAKIELQSAELVEKTTRIRLQQQVEQAFLNMKATYNRYKTLLQQVEAFQESFRTAEARFNEGVLNSVEYLTAKNNLDRANINLIVAKYEYVFRTRVLDYYQGKPIW